MFRSQGGRITGQGKKLSLQVEEIMDVMSS